MNCSANSSCRTCCAAPAKPDGGTSGHLSFEQLFPELPIAGRTRTELLERAGKVQVPYLVDPNTRTAMFESGAIRNYLLQTYAT